MSLWSRPLPWTLLAVCLSIASSCLGETLVYIGTYTENNSSEGIYVCRLDESSGKLSSPRLATSLLNPSFVALHPTRDLLYAVSETGSTDTGVVAYAIKPDGTLSELNSRNTRGAAACHLQVDPTGRCLGVANYTGGSCICFPIQADGSLGEAGSFHQHEGGSGIDPRRQSAPHAHSLNFSRDGTQAIVADLGKDALMLFDVDAEAGKMRPSQTSELALPGGGGPRHFCFHPSFRFAFANLEMTSQLALLRYSQEQRQFALGQVLDTLPASTSKQGNSTAECLVHPTGKYVYVSNRGHNSIARFSFDVAEGELSHLGNTPTAGKIPRGFGIDSRGHFLIVGNQKSGNVVSFRIDAETGELSPTGHQIAVDAPVNVRFKTR